MKITTLIAAAAIAGAATAAQADDATVAGTVEGDIVVKSMLPAAGPAGSLGALGGLAAIAPVLGMLVVVGAVEAGSGS